MAYNKGRSRLYADIGREEAAEQGRYETELSRAEDLREDQSLKKTLARWTGKLGYLFGPGIGAVTENVFPALVDYVMDAPEDTFVSTDPGKFGVSRRFDYEEVNKLLKRADEGETWRDVTDFGTSLLTAWELGGGDIKKPGSFRALTYGGEKGAEKHGRGIFGKGGADRQSVWDMWFS